MDNTLIFPVWTWIVLFLICLFFAEGKGEIRDQLKGRIPFVFLAFCATVFLTGYR